MQEGRGPGGQPPLAGTDLGRREGSSKVVGPESAYGSRAHPPRRGRSAPGLACTHPGAHPASVSGRFSFGSRSLRRKHGFPADVPEVGGRCVFRPHRASQMFADVQRAADPVSPPLGGLVDGPSGPNAVAASDPSRLMDAPLRYAHTHGGLYRGRASARNPTPVGHSRLLLQRQPHSTRGGHCHWSAVRLPV